MNMGWVCPKCDSVWAPTTRGCEFCNQPKKIKMQVSAEIHPMGSGPYRPEFLELRKACECGDQGYSTDITRTCGRCGGSRS